MSKRSEAPNPMTSPTPFAVLNRPLRRRSCKRNEGLRRQTHQWHKDGDEEPDGRSHKKYNELQRQSGKLEDDGEEKPDKSKH